MLGKHSVKIQEVIPWPILRISCPVMVFENFLCLDPVTFGFIMNYHKNIEMTYMRGLADGNILQARH